MPTVFVPCLLTRVLYVCLSVRILNAIFWLNVQVGQVGLARWQTA